MTTTLIFVSLAIAALAAIVRYGRFRWVDGTRKLRSRMEASRLPVMPLVVDFREFEVLPAPVQRYLRKVLKEGQPMIARACIKHEGTFNLGRTRDLWKHFTSDQWAIARRPGTDT